MNERAHICSRLDIDPPAIQWLTQTAVKKQEKSYHGQPFKGMFCWNENQRLIRLNSKYYRESLISKDAHQLLELLSTISHELHHAYMFEKHTQVFLYEVNKLKEAHKKGRRSWQQAYTKSRLEIDARAFQVSYKTNLLRRVNRGSAHVYLSHVLGRNINLLIPRLLAEF